jgi:hypothetical protein
MPMSPFRIRRPPPKRAALAPESDGGGTNEFKHYLDRLIRMIPTEVVGLYLVGNGVIPTEERVARLGWPVVCLIGLLVLRIYGTRDPETGEKAQWVTVLISAVAFVIWIYTLGGPFQLLGVYKPYVGSLLVLVWTFFVPIFYRGD